MSTVLIVKIICASSLKSTHTCYIYISIYLYIYILYIYIIYIYIYTIYIYITALIVKFFSEVLAQP